MKIAWTGIAVVALTIMHQAVMAQNKPDVVQDPIKRLVGLTIDNCGLSAMATTAILLNADYNLSTQLYQSDELQNTSHQWSLEEMKGLLNQLHLDVVGYTSCSTKDILDLCPVDGVVIAHIKVRGDFGHFVVIKSSDGIYTLYDYPACFKLTKNKIMGYLSTTSSGACLVVTNQANKAPIPTFVPISKTTEVENAAKAKFSSDETNIEQPPTKDIKESPISQPNLIQITPPDNMQITADDSDALEAKILVKNTGSTDLNIEKVTGACSCFSGYTASPVLLKAGTFGLVTCKFRKKIVSPIGTEIVITFRRDGQSQPVLLKLPGFFSPPAGFYVSPSVLVFSAGGSKRLTVLFPSDDQNRVIPKVQVPSGITIKELEQYAIAVGARHWQAHIYEVDYQDKRPLATNEELGVVQITSGKDSISIPATGLRIF